MSIWPTRPRCSSIGVIDAKLPLQGPIRHALPLTEEGNHLIERV